MNAGAQLQETTKSHYAGKSYEVSKLFFDGVVLRDGEDGMKFVANFPVDELMVTPISKEL